MPKPRRKVIRKPQKPVQANAAIQRLLDVQSDRKKNSQPEGWTGGPEEDGWGATEVDNSLPDDEIYSGDEYLSSEGEFDRNWTDEVMTNSQAEFIRNLYGPVPQYSVIFRGALISVGQQFKANLDVIMSLKLYPKGSNVPTRPLEGWQMSEYEVMASFTPKGYEQILSVRMIRLGQASYHIEPCRVTAQALLSRLEDMDAADDIDVGEDDPRDPLVAASLIPGLRRSEYTHAIDKRMYRGYCVHRAQLDMLKSELSQANS